MTSAFALVVGGPLRVRASTYRLAGGGLLLFIVARALRSRVMGTEERPTLALPTSGWFR